MKKQLFHRAIIIISLICAVVALISIGISYPDLYGVTDADGNALIPMYLKPWGGSLKDGRLNLFTAFRLPVMGLCLIIMFAALMPDENDKWPAEGLSAYRLLLCGLMSLTATQLCLNPTLTFNAGNTVVMAVVLSVVTVMELVGCALALKRLPDPLRPLCSSGETPWTKLLDMAWDCCQRRHGLIIATVAVFMVLLVIPSLSL